MGLFDGKRYFVLGMGKSGNAATRLLVREGADVSVFDDADAGADVSGTADDVRVVDAAVASDVVRESDCVVVSPGVPLQHPLLVAARAANVAVIGELELAYLVHVRGRRAKLVGVTGTNGKSTVVSMVGEILGRAGVTHVVAGNIGTPFSEVVAGPQRCDVIVLEISSFQLDTIDEFKLDVAVLLNVAADHLDRYNDSFDEYAASKARILNRADRETYFVYNDDDGVCQSIAAGFGGGKIPFSSTKVLGDGLFEENGCIVRRWRGEKTTILPLNQFTPVGIHNLENAMAAAAAVTPLDTSVSFIGEGLRAYHPLPHRMELVRVSGGVAYINDSKATNVDATIKSVKSIEGDMVLILGGLDKNGDFEALIPSLARVKGVVVIGAATEKIKAVLDGHVDVFTADTLADAVRQSAALAQAGDTVLLAPACASFDMFRSYADRGEKFRAQVNAL